MERAVLLSDRADFLDVNNIEKAKSPKSELGTFTLLAEDML